MARTSGKPGEPLEEYLLYVRVPDPPFDTPEKVDDFLVRLATLLSDDDENIYVEPYIRDEVTERSRDSGKHGEGTIKEQGDDCHGNSVAGTNQDGLRPMYFCHNKF